MTKTQQSNRRSTRSTNPIIKQQKPQPKINKKTIKLPLITKIQMRNKILSKLTRKNYQNTLQKPKSKTVRQSSSSIRQIFSPHRQKYQCAICLEIMIFPTLTSCGHAFCLPCFEQSLKHKKRCSICRDNIQCEDFRPSKTLTQMISLFKNTNFDKEDEESYYKRLEDFKTKEKQRHVGWTIKIGDQIDYCRDWKWLEGKVASIYQNDSHQTYLTVQSNSNKEEFYDYQITSRLIAKHLYFTRQNRWHYNYEPSHIRIQIFDIANFLENSQFFSFSSRYARRTQRQVMLEDSQDQFLRFSFRLEPRNS